MSDTSPRLSLPLIAPAQAQKHITHNEALSRLDVVTQLTLEGLEENTPPIDPQEGAVWALGTSPTGVWADHPASIAAFTNGGWLFIIPSLGCKSPKKGTGL